MTDNIHIDIAGDRQVGLRFDTFPEAIYADLRTAIDDLTRQVFALIQSKTPDRTGELLGQERLRVFADKDRISGYIDIAGDGRDDIVKAAALEYGSTGKATSVKTHSMALDHYWASKLAEPQSVIVAAYNRTPNIAEHAFERGPLDEMQPEIAARLNAVVDSATEVANR